MSATMKPEKPPRAPVNSVAKLCHEPWLPAAPKQKPAMTTIRRTLSQVSASCTLPDLRVPRMLSPVMSQVMTMAKIWLQSRGPKAGRCEKVKEREGSEDACQACCDGRDRSGLGDGDPRPHVEEAGEVAVGFAKEGVLAAVLGTEGCDLGVGHSAEEREQASDDPDRVDHARGADGGHHLARDQEDSAADDDADDDGGGV